MTKKVVSEIVRGAGMLTSIFSGVDQKLRAMGGTGEEWHQLTTPEGEGLLGEITKVLLGAKKSVDGVIRLIINYGQTLAEMIQTCNFDWVDDEVVKIFSLSGKGEVPVELKLYHFNRPIERDEAIKLMEADGYEAGLIEDGLAYAKANPDAQRQFPIIMLGSLGVSRSQNRVVPCLGRCYYRRSINLRDVDGQWDDYCRFLARRKLS